MEERVRARKEELLATHEVEPLSGELEREFGRILDAARRNLP